MRLKLLRCLSSQKRVCRGIHLTKSAHINPNNVTEVRIPVPWGHIAGKWWGDVGKQPVLATHGWQDNAGIWDPLLERLPKTRPVLAIDSPGHGLSSHFPGSMLYHDTNYIMTLRRIVQHFQWDSGLTIMGHSEGGVMGFIFSALYPELVKNLIAIDIIKPFAPYPAHKEKLGSALDDLIVNCRRDLNKNPSYSITDMEDRWIKGAKGSLTKDAVRILMKRGAQLDHESGKYFYTRDQRVKIDYFHLRFSEAQSLEMARNIKCHYRVVRFTKGWFLDYSLKEAPEFINTITQSAKSFKMVDVEGRHHTHLTHPDRVLPVISQFLNEFDASDK